jgi:ABC-type transporter Mla maintaining outer membrane lipid asymmetry permease subunit MlaE
VAARQGMRAEGGARGVGKAATQTVVIASVLVLLLDYLLMVILAPVMLGFDL